LDFPTMLRLIAVVCLVVVVVHGQPCGQTPVAPNLTQKVEELVGGSVAVPYSWPWQVVWCQKSSSGGGCSLMCGGSVIDNNWVVTAGHCVYGNTGRPGNFAVKVGVFDESSSTETGESVINVKSIHLHPQYRPNPVPSNDIALIELATPITYSDHIQPVCLAASDANVAEQPNSGWTTGWGTTSAGGQISRQLRQVQVPFVNATTCTRDYPGDINQAVMLCAGVQGRDSCQGDSGGPLVVQKSNRWYLVGLTSWGEGCAARNKPGVYGRVSAFCSFVAQTTGNTVQCS